jgi:putative spermidine/putrescine transport system substrate-binding protein
MKHLTRRQFLSMIAAASAGAAGLALSPRITFAQGPTATPGVLPPPPPAGPIDLAAAGGIEKLIEAARAEGELSTIALPDDWANYGEIKKVFFSRYDFLKHNDLAPDAGSAQEIEAIRANAGNKGPQNPDVIDVGFIWGKTAKEAGLLQPYKVATWDSIPADLKDPDGFWYADYYGTMAFEVNADVVKNVPQTWADLLKPEYKGQIALSGDPATAAQPAYAVWAAALANGGSITDPMPGLEFMLKLAESGNLIALPASPATVASGETPITMRWDYNGLSNRDANKDSVKIEVVYPKDNTIAGVYVQAISAYAPRPNAARLWMEFLYSDEGQLLWLKGYATPVRYEDLRARNVIPAELQAALPDVTGVNVAFPNVDQIAAGLKIINEKWNEVVGSKLG